MHAINASVFLHPIEDGLFSLGGPEQLGAIPGKKVVVGLVTVAGPASSGQVPAAGWAAFGFGNDVVKRKFLGWATAIGAGPVSWVILKDGSTEASYCIGWS